MNNFLAIVEVIARHVQRHLGDKSLNELIAQGIAVYLEIMKVIPASRAISKPADPDIVLAVIEELSELEA